MNAPDLSLIAGILASISVASERLVEIVKGYVPYLQTAKENAQEEGRRRAAVQLVAVFAGVATAFLARSILLDLFPEGWGPWQQYLAVFGLGLFAAGGSGFWNSIQGYANKVKELKKLESEDFQQRLAGG